MSNIRDYIRSLKAQAQFQACRYGSKVPHYRSAAEVKRVLDKDLAWAIKDCLAVRREGNFEERRRYGACLMSIVHIARQLGVISDRQFDSLNKFANPSPLRWVMEQRQKKSEKAVAA